MFQVFRPRTCVSNPIQQPRTKNLEDDKIGINKIPSTMTVQSVLETLRLFFFKSETPTRRMKDIWSTSRPRLSEIVFRTGFPYPRLDLDLFVLIHPITLQKETRNEETAHLRKVNGVSYIILARKIHFVAYSPRDCSYDVVRFDDINILVSIMIESKSERNPSFVRNDVRMMWIQIMSGWLWRSNLLVPFSN